MRPALRLLPGLCLLVLAPARLYAQAPAPSPSPSPTPFPSPSPSAEPSPPPRLPEAPIVSGQQPPAGGRPLADMAPPSSQGQFVRLPPWLLTVRLRESYLENPRFEAGSQDENTFVDSGGVTLSRFFRGSRGQLALTGNANGAHYHVDDTLNRFGWSAGLAGTHRFTPRTTFLLSEEVVSAYTRETALLTGGGVLLPLARTLSTHGAVEVAHQASTRNTLAVNARYDTVDFEDAALAEGRELALGARFGRQLSATGSLDMTYVHQRSMLETRTQPAHSLHLGWTGTSGPRFAFYLAGGATYLPATDVTTEEWAPYAAVEGAFNGRHGSFSVSYSHSVSQALGTGRVREADLVSAGASRSLATWATVFAHYGYSRSEDIFDPTYVFDAQGWEGGLRFGLTRDLTLTAAYVQRRSTTTGAAETVSDSAHLSLAYSKGF
ncbi:MAG TPA: hypothetical protein VFQ51_00125 [Vicinamibacteria bacterium]|nr:hypothetical protein [Vicinamibacteria bacterium]